MQMGENLLKWARHRAGLDRQTQSPFPPGGKFALELNESIEPFLSAYGRKDILGYVGFLDLVGFSDRVRGMKVERILAYLEPFLRRVIDAVRENDGMIDKMIGDEIMFVVPELTQDGGPPSNHTMPSLLADFLTLQRQLGAEYPMRLGLAFGALFLGAVQGNGYSEWTVVGEVVHLAKRLHGLKRLKKPDSIAAAVGVLASGPDSKHEFKNRCEFLKNIGWEIATPRPNEVQKLKGVGPAHAVYLLPRREPLKF